MAKNTLDLHGCRAEDVESKIDRFLMDLAQSHLKQAKIMTGKGTGTVKSITIKYLKLAGYNWEYEKLGSGNKPNEGCLVIFL